MKVLIINGRGMSGKDTFVKYFKENAKGRFVLNYSTIDTIKNIAKLLGYTDKKTVDERKLLHDMKMGWKNLIDGPFNETVERIKECDVNGVDYLFIHCREISEIERISKWCENNNIHCIDILVDDGKDIHLNNQADDDVKNYNYDFTIMNDGSLDDLNEKSGLIYNIVEALA